MLQLYTTYLVHPYISDVAFIVCCRCIMYVHPEKEKSFWPNLMGTAICNTGLMKDAPD